MLTLNEHVDTSTSASEAVQTTSVSKPLKELPDSGMQATVAGSPFLSVALGRSQATLALIPPTPGCLIKSLTHSLSSKAGTVTTKY